MSTQKALVTMVGAMGLVGLALFIVGMIGVCQ